MKNVIIHLLDISTSTKSIQKKLMKDDENKEGKVRSKPQAMDFQVLETQAKPPEKASSVEALMQKVQIAINVI